MPVDPGAPAARNAYILHDCAVAAIVTEQRFEQTLGAELEKLGAVPPILVIDAPAGGAGLRDALARAEAADRRRASRPTLRSRTTSPTSSTPPARPASPRA